MVGDIAFLPIEVLLVTLIIHQLLDEREKQHRLEKLNMVIGAFFSELGTELLAYLSDADPNLETIRNELIITVKWSEKEFTSICKRMKKYRYGVTPDKIDLAHLQGFLGKRRNFLLRLLENPNLLEHESFTELLHAVFHLIEELGHRGEQVTELPETDINHLTGDIKRVYGLIVDQWLDYMHHLKATFPYLFSLAMRTNPFDRDASPIVTK